MPHRIPLGSFPSHEGRNQAAHLLDLQGNIPTFIWITDAKYADVRILDVLVPEPGSIYIMDRGYIDFERLYRLHTRLS